MNSSKRDKSQISFIGKMNEILSLAGEDTVLNQKGVCFGLSLSAVYHIKADRKEEFSKMIDMVQNIPDKQLDTIIETYHKNKDVLIEYNGVLAGNRRNFCFEPWVI